MKLRTFFERLLIVALPLIALLCIAIPAHAAGSEFDPMDVDRDGAVDVSDVVALARFLVEDSDLRIEPPQDIDGDGLISVIDLKYILCHIAKLDPKEYLKTETTTTVTTTTTKKVTTTTTTPKVTTTTTKKVTTTTTTPKVTTTTTKKVTTTTTTPKATTTTTKKVTTTTTPKVTTTTTKKVTTTTTTPKVTTTTTSSTVTTTSTETTTTTTTTTVTYVEDNTYFRRHIVIQDCTWSHVKTPYNGDLHEADGSYFFKVNGETWAFNLLSDVELTDYQLLMQPEYIRALHIWKPSSDCKTSYLEKFYYAKIPDVSNPLPDTSERSWEDSHGQTHKYQLLPWDQLSTLIISGLSERLEANEADDVVYITRFDYDLSASITDADLSIITRYYFAQLPAKYGITSIDLSNTNYVYDITTKEFQVLETKT